MATSYGHKLNPYRRLRDQLGIKAIRQTVVVTNNPSTIDQNQQLLVRFPNLGSNDVIVPGTARLTFTLQLNSSKDPNRTIVTNIGRAIVKKKTVKIEGNEVLSVDDCDVFDCYVDLWKSTRERENSAYQGIANANALSLRIGSRSGAAAANSGQDKAIADTYEGRFCIPLDFELLESHMPFCQTALRDRLSYELTFNDYKRVIKSGDADASYAISGISLEYEMVTHPELARLISQQYRRTAVLYDRVLRHRTIVLNKRDTVWNVNLNTPARSMKGILMIFEDPRDGGKDFSRDPENFYNPGITKVEVTVEGIPNQLFAHGLAPHQQWEEIRKHFAGGKLRHPEVTKAAKDLHLADVTLGEYLTTKYALWLDMRSTDDDSLHGSGRRIENGSEGITIQISKSAEAAGALNMYLYVIMDGQLNIEDGRFVTALY